MLTYDLPRQLIAKRPVEPRDACRLLVLNSVRGAISHQVFRDLPALLRPGDCLVLNDTKVLPARLFGKKADTGGKVELLLLEKEDDSLYWCLGKPGKGLRPGARLIFNGAWHHQNGARHQLVGEVLSSQGNVRLVQFSGEANDEALFALGEIPLPPYIDRPVVTQDADWYQTVYARYPGAVAAPTAGLHFTPELLDRIRQQGVRIAFVTLHVGWGTFKPVTEEELASGRIHAERFYLPSATVEAINETKRQGGRIVAVGTTVVRALETYATGGGSGAGKEGTTDLFIRPPFEFKVVDALITNFHLPGTSLLFLVAAFAGEKQILKAYQEAIRERYRFYSYGDAMLIL